MKRLLCIVLSAIMLISAIMALPTVSYAASKPKATSITKVTASTKSFTVSWKKVSGASYQVQYSLNKNFKSSKKVNVKASKTSKKITNLKAKKKYYVRVRTCKNKKYSSWSKTKTVTTKASSSSGSSSSSSSPSRGAVVYITPTGTKYHYDKDCAGPNAIAKSLSEVSGTYEPCKKCAS